MKYEPYFSDHLYTSTTLPILCSMNGHARADEGEDKTTTTFNLFEPGLIERLRDTVVQPDNRFNPLTNRCGFSTRGKTIHTFATSREHQTKMRCSYSDPDLSGLEEEKAIIAIFYFTGTLSKQPYLTSGPVEYSFKRSDENAPAESCWISGQMEESDVEFRTELPLAKDTETLGHLPHGPETTTVETTVKALGKIIDVHEHDKRFSGSEICEMRVENGEFRIDTRENGSTNIWGSLPTERVEGIDFVNPYPLRPIKLISRRFDGPVTLKTGPSEPLKIIHEDDSIQRTYLINNVAE